MSRIEIMSVPPQQAKMETSSPWTARREAAIPGIQIETADPYLDGNMLAFDFAGARLWWVESRTQRIVRQRPCPGGRFQPMAVFLLEGRTRISQFNESEELYPGEFRFLDAAKPLVIEEKGHFQLLYLQFPKYMLGAGTFQIAARSPRARSWAFDRTFFDCAVSLWETAEALAPCEHAPALAALVSLANMSSPFRAAETQSAIPVRVTRAMAFIEHNLGESWLTPMAVAEAQNVSRRYLDDLFIRLGFSVGGWIWERRIQRAAEELRLYGQFKGSARRTILQIALDLGYKNPSHFTRSFTSRYGMSPREFRKNIVNDQSDGTVPIVH